MILTSIEPQASLTSRIVPFVSVIVPVRNEEAFIANTLDQLFAQHYPQESFEVIVADGMSTDATRLIVTELQQQHPGLKLVDNPARWSSAGRNAGIRVSQGDLLLIIDGHCEIRNHEYLHQFVAAFDKHDADCVGRPQPLEIPHPSLLQRAIALARSSWLGHHPASYIYSATEQIVPAHSVGVGYRRSVFDHVGLFDETFDACEDVELNHRVDEAGLRCVVVPKLRVIYHPRSNCSALFKQMVRYGRGRVRLLRKHPKTFSVTGFLPALLLAGILCGPVTFLLSQWFAVVYVAALLLYAAVVLGVSLITACRKSEWRALALMPIVFLMVHFGAGSGILAESLGLRLRPMRFNEVTP